MGYRFEVGPKYSLEDSGLLLFAFDEEKDNKMITHFHEQHFMHLSLDGNKQAGTNYKNSYGNFGTYDNSSFIDIRVHDFPHYGFDPHHNSDSQTATEYLTITDSLTDHNDVDGLTTDTCNHSLFKNNIIDGNGRHGINVCTGATNNEYLNNVITNNGGNGIVIQPGSITSNVSNGHVIQNNVIADNKNDGIFIKYSQDNQISNNVINNNGRFGIMLFSSSNNHLVSNKLEDNSQRKLPSYSGILLFADDSAYSSHNEITNNKLINTNPAIYKFGIGESNKFNDFNQIIDNFFQNIKVPISLKGENSIAKDNVSTNP